MTTFILGALLGATLTLPAFVRLIRQRDAAERGRLMLLARCDQQEEEFGKSNTRLLMRNRLLMDQLDKQIEETGSAWELLMALDERTKQLEAEALPKAPNWGAAPAEWRSQPDSHEWLGMLR